MAADAFITGFLRCCREQGLSPGVIRERVKLAASLSPELADVLGEMVKVARLDMGVDASDAVPAAKPLTSPKPVTPLKATVPSPTPKLQTPQPAAVRPPAASRPQLPPTHPDAPDWKWQQGDTDLYASPGEIPGLSDYAKTRYGGGMNVAGSKFTEWWHNQGPIGARGGLNVDNPYHRLRRYATESRTPQQLAAVRDEDATNTSTWNQLLGTTQEKFEQERELSRQFQQQGYAPTQARLLAKQQSGSAGLYTTGQQQTDANTVQSLHEKQVADTRLASGAITPVEHKQLLAAAAQTAAKPVEATSESDTYWGNTGVSSWQNAKRLAAAEGRAAMALPEAIFAYRTVLPSAAAGLAGVKDQAGNNVSRSAGKSLLAPLQAGLGVDVAPDVMSLKDSVQTYGSDLHQRGQTQSTQPGIGNAFAGAAKRTVGRAVEAVPNYVGLRGLKVLPGWAGRAAGGLSQLQTLPAIMEPVQAALDKLPTGLSTNANGGSKSVGDWQRAGGQLLRDHYVDNPTASPWVRPLAAAGADVIENAPAALAFMGSGKVLNRAAGGLPAWGRLPARTKLLGRQTANLGNDLAKSYPVWSGGLQAAAEITPAAVVPGGQSGKTLAQSQAQQAHTARTLSQEQVTATDYNAVARATPPVTLEQVQKLQPSQLQAIRDEAAQIQDHFSAIPASQQASATQRLQHLHGVAYAADSGELPTELTTRMATTGPAPTDVARAAQTVGIEPTEQQPAAGQQSPGQQGGDPSVIADDPFTAFQTHFNQLDPQSQAMMIIGVPLAVIGLLGGGAPLAAIGGLLGAAGYFGGQTGQPATAGPEGEPGQPVGDASVLTNPEETAASQPATAAKPVTTGPVVADFDTALASAKTPADAGALWVQHSADPVKRQAMVTQLQSAAASDPALKAKIAQVRYRRGGMFHASVVAEVAKTFNIPAPQAELLIQAL